MPAMRPRHQSLHSAAVVLTTRDAQRSTRRLTAIACVCAVALAALLIAAQPAAASNGTNSSNKVAFHIAASVNPSTTANALSGASCVSARFCMAVGYYVDTDVNRTLGEVWNGARWLASPTVNPSQTTNYLVGVSCTSARFCVAVGSQGTFNAKHTLAEVWNGSRWAVQRSADPRAADAFASVACVRVWCMAAGVGTSANGVGRGLLEVLRGGRWSSLGAPLPAGSELQGVACSSARACVAVGDRMQGAHQEPIALSWNGRRWAAVAVPRPGVENTLSSVACTSAKSCVAVGTQVHGAQTRTLALRWNGRSWRNFPMPSLQGRGSLWGIACPGARSCEAVGTIQRGANSLTLAERFDGRRWYDAISVNPTANDGFNGVACPPIGACTPVGYAVVGQGVYDALIERGA